MHAAYGGQVSPSGVEELFARYPVDERAKAYVLASAPQVIERVVQMFKPPREGERDYSGLLTTYVKKLRQTCASDGPEPTASAPELQRMVDEFTLKYPIDEGAYSFLVGCPPDVMQKIIREFVPRREGERDYSALLMTYAKKIRAEASMAHGQQAFSGGGFAGGGGAGGFAGAQTFAPSGGVRSPSFAPDSGNMGAMAAAYRAGARGQPMPGTTPVTTPPLPTYQEALQAGLIAQSSPIAPQTRYTGLAAQPARPTLTPVRFEDIEDFRARFPVDDRCIEYMLASSIEAQYKILREFQVKREGEADYSGLFMAFAKKCRTVCDQGSNHIPQAPCAAGGMGGQAMHFQGHGPHGPANFQSFGNASGPITSGGFNLNAPGGGKGGGGGVQMTFELAQGLEEFRQWYPMDDRAFTLLVSSSPEVCDRVIKTFVPPRHGLPDYSAPVQAYVRECRRTMTPSGNLPPQDAGVRASGGGAPWMGPDAAKMDPETQSLLQRFLTRFPVDDRCVQYITRSSPDVVWRVLSEFVPKVEGDSDYSAIVMSFTKRIKEQERTGTAPNSAAEGSAKRQRMY